MTIFQRALWQFAGVHCDNLPGYIVIICQYALWQFVGAQRDNLPMCRSSIERFSYVHLRLQFLRNEAVISSFVWGVCRVGSFSGTYHDMFIIDLLFFYSKLFRIDFQGNSLVKFRHGKGYVGFGM